MVTVEYDGTAIHFTQNEFHNSKEREFRFDKRRSFRASGRDTVILDRQIEDLCSLHDHITRVVAGADLPCDEFTDQYPHKKKATFEFEPVLRMFLYMKVRDITQPTLHDRLKGTAYLWVRFGLGGIPTQQAISYMWRERFSLADRLKIAAIARLIREIASEHDIISENEPRIDLELVDDEEIEDKEIQKFVEEALERGLGEFETGRASNAKYGERVFRELQGYLNMADRGTTTRSKGSNSRFGRISDRDEVPCPDNHFRVMKKIATPPEQTTLADYSDGRKIPEWQRIRDEVLRYFHRGLNQLITEVKENSGIREPVIVAIDITPWEFHPSPYKNEEDASWDDETVIVNGERRTQKKIFPK